jgi:hypothetical protein
LVHLINHLPPPCILSGRRRTDATRQASYFLNGAIIVQRWSHASFRIGHALTVTSLLIFT